jgi:hypothetical protein
LANLAVDHSLLVATPRVAGHHPPPKTDSRGIAQVLGDLPPTGEPIEYEVDGRTAHPQTPAGSRNEKLRHAVLNNGRTRRLVACHHREADSLRRLENDERKRIAIAKPARNLVRLAVPYFAQDGKQARAQGREIVQIIAIDIANPESITLGGASISNADSHDQANEDFCKKTRPGQLASAIRPGRLELKSSGSNSESPDLSNQADELLTSAAWQERRPEAERLCRQQEAQRVHQRPEQQVHPQREPQEWPQWRQAEQLQCLGWRLPASRRPSASAPQRVR